MRSVLSDMIRRRFTTLVGTALVLGVSASAAAQHGAWVHLGTKEIEGHVDHDKISCHGKDEYRALQFRVTGAAVQFDRIQVEYGNHQTRVYPFRMRVRANGASPVLDLAGGYRDITNGSSGTRRRPGARSRRCDCTDGNSSNTSVGLRQ